jgi:chromosome segregation ATPase
MEQLSGGEKSLASIALQFAIAVVTHAPMLVFDETDAFLDVGNVGGVLRLVRRGIEGIKEK